MDTHYGLAKMAVNAGKNTYVEWPLGSNADEARELVSLAKEKGVKTVVGLQGRREPTILKAKEIIESGRLGTVHSVNVYTATGVWQTGAVRLRYDYMLDRKVGGKSLDYLHGTWIGLYFVRAWGTEAGLHHVAGKHEAKDAKNGQ